MLLMLACHSAFWGRSFVTELVRISAHGEKKLKVRRASTRACEPNGTSTTEKHSRAESRVTFYTPAESSTPGELPASNGSSATDGHGELTNGTNGTGTASNGAATDHAVTNGVSNGTANGTGEETDNGINEVRVVDTDAV